MLADGAADREVHPPPAAAQGLDAGLQVLDEVPGREAADVLERRAAPEEPGAAREDGVGGVAGQHRAAEEVRLEVVEGVAAGDDGLLDRLHEGGLGVRGELTDAAAQEAAVAHEVVGVARLDEGGVGRELVEAVQRRVEVARLGVPLALRGAAPRRAHGSGRGRARGLRPAGGPAARMRSESASSLRSTISRSFGQSWFRTDSIVPRTCAVVSPDVGTITATSGSLPWATTQSRGVVRVQLLMSVTSSETASRRLAARNGTASHRAWGFACAIANGSHSANAATTTGSRRRKRTLSRPGPAGGGHARHAGRDRRRHAGGGCCGRPGRARSR